MNKGRTITSEENVIHIEKKNNYSGMLAVNKYGWINLAHIKPQDRRKELKQ